MYSFDHETVGAQAKTGVKVIRLVDGSEVDSSFLLSGVVLGSRRPDSNK